MTIRPATPADAAAVAGVLNGVIAEGGLTLFDSTFSEADERAFIESLDVRSVLLVAEVDGRIVGVQAVSPYSGLASSLRHVATLGTWIQAAARGRGIGRQMAERSFAFMREAGYRKVLITVLAGNQGALAFYARLGFEPFGTAREHVNLGGVFHDEVFMERRL